MRRRRPFAIALALFSLTLIVPLATSQLQAQPAAQINDPLLLVQWPQSPRSGRQMLADRKVAVIGPNGTTPLLDGAQQPQVSPDGRQVYFIQYRLTPDNLTATLVTLDAASMATLWSAPIASEPLSGAAREPFTTSVASNNETVFVATLATTGAMSVEIQALSREHGAEKAHWSVDLGRATMTANLLADPDGSSITIMALGLGAFTESTAPPLTAIRLRASDGAEQARFTFPDYSDAGEFAWSATSTPDGYWLFKVGFAMIGPTTTVAFLDQTSGAVERLDIRFNIPNTQTFAPREAGTSPDGRLLYVVSPISREMAVVDLTSRTVVQQAPLTMPAASHTPAAAMPTDWLVGTAEAKVPFSEHLQVSADGQRMYGVAATAERNNIRADGVWEIDTQQWSVTRQLLRGTQPWSVFLSPDNNRLYVHDTASAGTSLYALDLSNDQPESGPQRLLSSGQLFSVADQYRDRYGHALPRASAEPAARPRPVPGMSIGVSSADIVAGDPLQLEVRFTNPLTGGALAESDSDVVQFTPPARVSAALTQSLDADARPGMELTAVAFGVYRGTLSAPLPAVWLRTRFGVDVLAEWSEGAQRRGLLTDAVTVRPSFAGSDGRRYVMRAAADPTPPRVNQMVHVSLSLVDAVTGAPLPEPVELVSGAPDHLDVTFYSGQGGVSVRRLNEASHGTYATEVSLFSSGEWQILASLNGDTYQVSTLTVDR